MNTASNNIIAVLILAGGQSTRMGYPKALLPLPNGDTLLQFHIRNAQTLQLPILIADNGKNFYTTIQKNCISIKDQLPTDNNKKGAGPLSAILSACNIVQKNGYILTISCDTLLDIYQIYTIVQNTHAQAGYLMAQKEYPLLGVYHTNIAFRLAQFLAQNERSVMKFLTHISCQKFYMPSTWQKLANFNTKDEYNRALDIFIHHQHQQNIA